MQVCTVIMVPTRSGLESSTTLAENCAESAITAMPQTMQNATSSQGGLPNRNPASTAQLPLNSMAAMVSVVRPKRSASTPPARQPKAPKPDRGEGCNLGPERREGEGAELQEACFDEGRDPGPHRIKLPHVSVIAEIGQPQRPLAPGIEHVAGAELGGAGMQRPVVENWMSKAASKRQRGGAE